DLLSWAREQLKLAAEIVDNPGGGLLFGTQTIGQVRSALADADEERWREVVRILDQAEDSALRRQYERARELVGRVLAALTMSSRRRARPPARTLSVPSRRTAWSTR